MNSIVKAGEFGKVGIFGLLSISNEEMKAAAPHELRVWLKKTEILIARERGRGRNQHFRYDLNRHIALAAVKRAITERLKN